MENTSMQKLSRHLSAFLPVLIEHSCTEYHPLTAYEILTSGDIPLRKSTLYVWRESDFPGRELPEKPYHFLILAEDPQKIVSLIGARTDALILPAQTCMKDLHVSLDGFFLAAAAFRDFCPMLLSELEHGNRLKQYLNLFCGFTGHPVIIWDSNRKILSHSDLEQRASDDLWDLYLTQSDALPDIGPDFREAPPDQDGPVFYEKDGTSKRILLTLQDESTHLFVMEILEGSKPFQNSDLAFAACVGSFLRFQLSAQSHSAHQDSIGRLMEDVITGKISNQHQIYRRAEALNYFPGSHNYLLLIYSLSDISFRRTFQAVRDLQKLTPHPTILLGSEILTLVSGSKSMETVTDEIIPYLNQQPCFKCSCSAVFSGLPLLKNAYEQCSAAKDLGSVLNPNGTWFDYEAYRELHFTNKYLSDADVEFFCLPVAKEIVQHDRVQKTRYAYTLMLYIKNFKNAATVARMMNIHRNTMFYRLEKIANLFDIHYDNPVQMNNLSLSFNILASRYPDIFN